MQNLKNVKAMWLSQFDLESIYQKNGAQRAKSEFIPLIERVLDNVKNLGIDTVILQVRPNADSMVPSKIYCPSHYVVGDYGKDFLYDPVALILDMAHERGLYLHAWINPLRAMTVEEMKKVPVSFRIKQWWENEELKKKYLAVADGRVYLNPAYDEITQMIIDGAREILRDYPVDGLHMDDYFYPTQDVSFDAESFQTLGNGAELADWRRENVNRMIRKLYAALKESNPDIPFGISPAGSLRYNYDGIYADVYTWCKQPGYMDYLVPQFYFGMEHGTCDFAGIAKKWSDFIGYDLPMWAGMSLGKAVRGSEGAEDPYGVTPEGKTEWIVKKDVLKRCLQATENLPHCVGVCYFCYHYFFDPLTGKEEAKTKEERENFLPLLKKISW